MSPISRLLHRQAGPPGAQQQFPPSTFTETDKGGVLGIPSVFTGIALIVVLLRIYVRTTMLKSFGGDDYTIIVAMAFSIVGFVAQVYAVKLGVGHHAPALKLTNMGAILEWRFYAGLLVVAGVSLVKISVGLALLRLFQRKAHRIFLWVTIAFLVVFTTASLGTLIFQCIPVRAAWDLTLREKPSTRCWTMDIFRDIGVFNSSINIATDILFACMPIPLIWKLQMNTRTKVTLICVLGLGFFASAAAVVKSVYQYNFFTTLDWSFHDNFNVFALIEFNAGIIAASLPSLKPFFNWLQKTARTLTSGRSTDARPYNGSSLAYVRPDQKEVKVGSQYALHPLGSRPIAPGRSPSRAKHLYDVHISSGEDIDYINGETTWEPPSRAKKSDDFILPKGRPPTPGSGILMTTEFRVT